MPVYFECQRCTACCRWPGQVKLTEPDIRRISAFKAVDEVDFIQRFTRLTADRRGLALQDKSNGECIFLDGRDCTVQPAKPQQCRDFPNRWNFPGFQDLCQAVPRQVSTDQFEKRMTEDLDGPSGPQ